MDKSKELSVFGDLHRPKTAAKIFANEMLRVALTSTTFRGRREPCATGENVSDAVSGR